MASKKQRSVQKARHEELRSEDSLDVTTAKQVFLVKELERSQKDLIKRLSLLESTQSNLEIKEALRQALKKYLDEYEFQQVNKGSEKDLAEFINKQSQYTSEILYAIELLNKSNKSNQINQIFYKTTVEEIINLESIRLEYVDLSKKEKIKKAVQLNEAKMIIVGQGEVGKTSLIKRLLDNSFDPLETKTDGINIRQWSLPVAKKQVRVNIWDFGGQEIMHATHQFFLTKRSLYVLVVAARKDEYQNNLEYWLKLIQSFGGNSPVIIVVNKSEDGHLDLAKRNLQSKYPNISAFVETSCKSGEGIQGLKDAIVDELTKLKLVYGLVDERWINIKNQLEKMREDYIEYEKYQKICREFGISSVVEQRNLIRFLHDLGTILNFGLSETTQRLDIRLENTNVINPEWVTKGVYAILNSSTLNQENGVIKLEQLGNVLDNNKYPKDKQIYIIEMMKKFELCFELSQERDKFLVVAGNLAKDEPDLRTWTENHPLKFEFHYNFLPSSVISRFIVRMYQEKINNLYWRTGIAIKYQENEALIKADLSENKIYIYVTGSSRTRREFLAIIRSEIIRINNTIAQLEAKEMVPFEGLLLDYDELLGLEKMGETTIPLSKLQKRVKIQEILAIVDPKNQRNKGDEIMRKNNPWTSGSFYLIAFVVVITAIGLLAQYISWVAIPVVLIASLLAISIIGALQLRNDNELKDESFVKLVIEFYKRLPLLRKSK